MAEHSTNLGHRIKLQDTAILSTKMRYMDRTIRETIEIEPHPKNTNREGGFHLSQSYKDLIHTLKKTQEKAVAALPVPLWPLGHNVLFRISSSPGQYHISFLISCYFFKYFPSVFSYHIHPPSNCPLITCQSPGALTRAHFSIYSLLLSFPTSQAVTCPPPSSPIGSQAFA
jgi:hypothetical protein